MLLYVQAITALVLAIEKHHNDDDHTDYSDDQMHKCIQTLQI